LACNYNSCANVNNGSCVLATTYFADADSDGFGNVSAPIQLCAPQAGYVSNSTDCNDSNNAIRPGATEICDGVDNDCDGQTDEGVLNTYFRDADIDGYGNSAITTQACSAPVGYVTNSTDCNDNSSAAYPGATEVCDGLDNNCNGQTDEGVLLLFYRDFDNDGYGNLSITTQACSAPVGYVANSSDCNDSNGAINPGATEICDGVDNDCDGLSDENGCGGLDNDSDGYTAAQGDCNDSNPDVNPGADEWCNGIDDNCDGLIDENLALTTYYADSDGDGYGNGSVSQISCAQPLGFVLVAGDCNDTNADTHPGALEVCNGSDDDCDGTTDEGCGPINDEMESALILFPTTVGICNLTSGTLIGATPSAPAMSGCITCEDVWYYFTAPSPGVRIQCQSVNTNIMLELCTDGGVPVNQENQLSGYGNEILLEGNLIEGNTYFLRVANYNNAQGQGAFSLCINKLSETRCDNAPGTYPMCGTFKADFVGAHFYQFRFTSTTTNQTYVGQVNGGSTVLALSWVPGLQYADTYTLAIDAGYNLPNSTGGMETVIVTNNQPCVMSVGPHALAYLRAADRCPVNRNLGSAIACMPFVCGITHYQWEFTRTDVSGSPFAVNGNNATRFIQLQASAGLVAGGTYSVRVRPVFSYGIGNYGPSFCLKIGGSGMALEDTNEWSSSTARGMKTGADEFGLYPNPNDGQSFSVDLADSDGTFSTLTVLDMHGRIVAKLQFDEPVESGEMISLPQTLSPGIYVMRITGHELNASRRFVVQN